ncbi:hypothetical protein AB3S75_032422 [Citrus x aurantiifolia]
MENKKHRRRESAWENLQRNRKVQKRLMSKEERLGRIDLDFGVLCLCSFLLWGGNWQNDFRLFLFHRRNRGRYMFDKYAGKI